MVRNLTKKSIYSQIQNMALRSDETAVNEDNELK